MRPPTTGVAKLSTRIVPQGPNLANLLSAAAVVPIDRHAAKINFKTAVPQQPEIHVGRITVAARPVGSQDRERTHRAEACTVENRLDRQGQP
jgi:hypothetical protein